MKTTEFSTKMNAKDWILLWAGKY